jgi:Rrf2 family protein
MLQVTKRGDYGVLAVYHIAKYSAADTFMPIDEIAARSHVPRPYLSKILQDLCRGGILASRRGFGGGFVLGRQPEQITLADILECVAGKHALLDCTGNSDGCPRMEDCLALPFWCEIQNVLDDLIAGVTIADLIKPERRRDMIARLQQCRQMYRQMLHDSGTIP